MFQGVRTGFITRSDGVPANTAQHARMRHASGWQAARCRPGSFEPISASAKKAGSAPALAGHALPGRPRIRNRHHPHSLVETVWIGYGLVPLRLRDDGIKDE